MQKIVEIEQGVPEICPRGQVSQGASVSGANVAQSPARSFYLGETFKVKKKIDTGYF